jgi:hypothetical protein
MKSIIELLTEISFNIGDKVFFVLYGDSKPGFVTSIWIKSHGILYSVSWSDKTEKYHYGFELSKEIVLEKTNQ